MVNRRGKIVVAEGIGSAFLSASHDEASSGSPPNKFCGTRARFSPPNALAQDISPALCMACLNGSQVFTDLGKSV